MKLLKYQVTGFRSVAESGWIDASDVTALIGENEAGKTNLLLPLWKFNPSSDGEIHLLNDMPRSRYAEMRLRPQDHVFITCIFQLNSAAISWAVRFGIPEEKAQQITISRAFDGTHHIKFVADESIDLTTCYEAKEPIIGDDGTEEEQERGSSLFNMILIHVPKFVYYSNYGNLDSQIYLPNVVSDMAREDLDAKEAAKSRTLKVLFDLVNLSAQEILELGMASSVTAKINPQGILVAVEPKDDEEIKLNEEQLRERAALLGSASSKLTKSFVEWWKQGKYRFRLDADGSYFRIWVSDEQRPDEIELANRSTGLQWFLSFFLVFTYESSDAHKGCIVLLDEPGHSLHPLAQKDLSKFFDSLSKTNQILFTTHSPFMIDADRLDRVRKVQMDENGLTIASSDLGHEKSGKRAQNGAGATYAVYSAINLSVSESLLLGCAPVIVEGPSDQHYLTAIKSILIAKNKISPKAELVFPPSGGAKTAKIIASILMGKDDTLPVVLLDGDTAGQQAAKSLKESLYVKNEGRVLTTDDVLELKGSEIEDLVPAEIIIQVLDRLERRADVDFEDFYEAGKPIVPQIKSWADSEGLTLSHGWKVELSLGVKTKLLASAGDKLTDVQMEPWVSLFNRFFKG